MVTALARVDGRPLGVVANDPAHLGGAIDADSADKAARFLQLCDAFALPIVSLVDTPGFMVGPEIEEHAQVRHVSRMFIAGAHLQVPLFAVVLRKGYGLGAQAMAGGGFKVPLFTVAWPTSEFGAMGLEGAVRLGMRRELEAIDDPLERERVFEATVAAAYERGRGVNMAAYGEIDDVIDPADSRRWIATLLDDASGEWWQSAGKRRPHIDAW
jgi:acetyl-CoA carboxylase carboxyltransferase component